MRVLISSCVRQPTKILERFLESVEGLVKPCDCDYYFIENGLDESAHVILNEWAQQMGAEVEEDLTIISYPRTEVTHQWTENLVTHVIEMKERILEKARNYDYLLLIDSDNYLHPNTLTHLISKKRDIIHEICWTRWTPNEPEMPSAWMKHPYEFPDYALLNLRTKKLLKVAGFGGLYLISRKALNKGVSFKRVEGISRKWGEDRHFAVRAERLGLSMWCDTEIPSFHIYRLSEIPQLMVWKANNHVFPKRDYSVRKGTVLIGVCIGETEPHNETAAWLLHTLKRNPSWGLEISRAHPIDSNRNMVVKKFLTLPEAQKYEWLLFVDSDVVPPPYAAEILLSRGKKIVGGVCFIMGNDGYPIPNISKELEGGFIKPELMEVKGMGTGCILIHREVLKKIKRNHFRFRYDKWGIAGIAGEDYDFCEKAVKKGYKIYADLTVQCEHYKTVGLTTLNRKMAELVKQSHE